MRAKDTSPAIVACMLIAALLAFMRVGPSAAAAVVETEHVRAELVAETATIPTDGSVWVSLRLDIRRGWHTYWRNPGDAGEPTRIAWRLPAGIEASDILWPPPKTIPYGPLVNFGYEGRVDHLVKLTLPPSWPVDAALEVEAEASWLVCEKICIPEQGRFRLRWAPASASGAGENARIPEFDRLRGALPVPAAWPVSARAEEGGLILAMTPPAAADTVAATFFPYDWGLVAPAGRQVLSRHGNGGLELALPRGERAPEVLEGVLVLSQRTPAGVVDRAFETAANVQTATADATASFRTSADGTAPDTTGLARAVVLALLGGLLLNLMPCVFPVLSMKAIGLMHHADASARERRASGLGYTVGVMTFMTLVSGLLILLKDAGAQIGWGFQLQSPAFVSVMAMILFLLGLSFAGWFSFGASAMGWGSSLAGRVDGVGSFFTGALAALVATPCTAPFMGAAIGFALTQPWASATVVMLALGLGLALPYLLISWVPGVARWLPRPGPWMDRLKQFLAFPLFASAAWLIWVLAVQVGPSGVLAVLMALIAVALAIWLGRVSGESHGGWRIAGRIAAATLAAAAAVLALLPETLPPTAGVPRSAAAAPAASMRAEPFSQRRLDQLQAAGTPVFVNMTAAWCITCKLNEQVALSTERTARALAERGFVYLKGDWTLRDAEITRFLERFGRSGVPLYVVYRGDDQSPLVLPQLLTETIVLEAIEGSTRLSTIPSATERSS